MATLTSVSLELNELENLALSYQILFESARKEEKFFSAEYETFFEQYQSAQEITKKALGKPYYEAFLEAQQLIWAGCVLALEKRTDAYQRRCKYSDLSKSYEIRLENAKYHGASITIEVHE